MRVLRSRIARGKTKICAIRNEKREMITDKVDITDTIQRFYSKLYSVSSPKPDKIGDGRLRILNVGSKEIPEIDKDELWTTMKMMKNQKAP